MLSIPSKASTLFTTFPEKFLNGMSTTGKFISEFPLRITVSLVIGVASLIFSPVFGIPFLVYSFSALACRSVLILTEHLNIDLFGSYKQQMAHVIDTCFFLPLLVSIVFFAIYPLWPPGTVVIGFIAGVSTQFWHHIDLIRRNQREEIVVS